MSIATLARPEAGGSAGVARRAAEALEDELARLGRRRPLDPSSIPPCVDAAACRCSVRTGFYVATDRPLVPLALVVDQVVIPADAGPDERAAILADAVAYVAGPGPLDAFAAVEALACGTPVIARAGTPAAEVIEPGLTGLVVDLDGEVGTAAAFFAADLDRWACRKVALDRYAVERVALDLLAADERSAMAAAA